MNAGQMRMLIRLANEAKSVGDYRSANIAFAKLMHVFSRMDDYNLDEGAYLVPVLETDDPGGGDLNEVYYDLAVFAFDDGRGHLELCIPVPLLSPFAALAFYKAAVATEARHKSDREVVEEAEYLTRIRAKRITELVGGDEEVEHLLDFYLGLPGEEGDGDMVKLVVWEGDKYVDIEAAGELDLWYVCVEVDGRRCPFPFCIGLEDEGDSVPEWLTEDVVSEAVRQARACGCKILSGYPTETTPQAAIEFFA